MGFLSPHAPQVWRAKLRSSQLVAVKKVGPNWTVLPTKGDELGSYGSYGSYGSCGSCGSWRVYNKLPPFWSFLQGKNMPCERCFLLKVCSQDTVPIYPIFMLRIVVPLVFWGLHWQIDFFADRWVLEGATTADLGQSFDGSTAETLGWDEAALVVQETADGKRNWRIPVCLQGKSKAKQLFCRNKYGLYCQGSHKSQGYPETHQLLWNTVAVGQGEIHILRKMDHPRIVRPMYPWRVLSNGQLYCRNKIWRCCIESECLGK